MELEAELVVAAAPAATAARHRGVLRTSAPPALNLPLLLCMSISAHSP